MEFMHKISSIFLVMLLVCNAAGASLVEVDLYSSGDSLLTKDTDTGLYWLDLTETTNISYNDMVEELRPGGLFDGYRYANTADIEQLQLSAGLSTGLYSSFHDMQKIQELMGKVGITDVSAGAVFSSGLTSDPFSPSIGLDRITRGFSITQVASTRQGVIGDDDAFSWAGSWLTKSTLTPVPLPGAFLLFFSGFGLFVGWINRKKGAYLISSTKRSESTC